MTLNLKLLSGAQVQFGAERAGSEKLPPAGAFPAGGVRAFIHSSAIRHLP